MELPKDPYMLLSVVNMKLRDAYPDLDDLCYDLSVHKAELTANLENIGYAYDGEINQFVPIPK